MTISSHKYLDHPDFDDNAKNTIKIHDGLDYGSRENWGISFSCEQNDYCPEVDELQMYPSRFYNPLPDKIKYWNFEDVKAEISSLALQFYNLTC